MFFLFLFILHIPGTTQENKELNETRQNQRVQTLQGLTETESKNLYQSILERAYFELNYKPASSDKTKSKDRYENLSSFKRLKKTGEDGKTYLLFIGLCHYAAKDSELILDGHIVSNEQKKQPNPDLTELNTFLSTSRKRIQKKDKTYSISELKIKFYQLSNILPEQCLTTLNSLGYNTTQPSSGEKLSFDELPIVYRAPKNNQPIIIGTGEDKKLNTPTQSAPQNRLIFLYHPSQEENIVKLSNLLNKEIDVASRQVLIESLVVELTEEGRKELGVEWDGENDRGSLSSTFQTDSSGDTPLEVTGNFFTFEHGMNELQADLRALIKTNDAQVLSSPSVLTLNNTQARIQVIEEVPVIKTIVTEISDLAKVDVDFKDVGITLNIKPRITNQGNKVTMQIQGEVSEAPLSDFVEINGEKVAPRINRRKVQTIAQVNNNTPFIIGGLIRQKKTSQVDRVPLLSQLPLMGHLFKVQKQTTERREDIIVLNPRVISPEGSKRPIKPKDSQRFDFLDNKLFRNSYRLKSEDVFDLSFIENNENINEWLKRARTFAKEHPEFKEQPPFNLIKQNRIPGEEAAVIRMIYEIIQKLQLHKRIDTDQLIFFDKNTNTPSGFELKFLHNKLREAGMITENGEFVQREYPKTAIILRYNLDPEGDIQKISNTPVAEVNTRNVSSAEEADELWRRGNALETYERPQTTIVIDDQEDLERLKKSIVIREFTSVNDVPLRLDKFRVGRKMVIPQIKKQNDRIFLIDQNVSEYVYQSEFYYAVLKSKLKQYHEGVQRILKNHDK